MISTTRMNRVIQMLSPHLPKEQREAIIAKLKEMLGYDAAKASRFRKEAKDRNEVLDTICTLRI